MIDLALLREDTERLTELLNKKDPDFDVKLLIDLDKNVRAYKLEIDDLRREKNELAKSASSGLVSQEVRDRSKEVSAKLKIREQELVEIEEKFKNLYLSCPNVPQEDIPVGNKESNKVVKEFGKKPNFSFKIKDHIELGESLGWLDFDTATRIAGSNFAFYRGDAVKLKYALVMYMLKNNLAHGFEPILPPYLVNEKSLTVSGNFPKFRDQVYEIKDEGLFLTPTAEVDLANIYRDKILNQEELPIRMTAWTSCFRREAGAYGAAERGLIRIHQFEKAELFSICEPQNSNQELDSMVACAENILQKLNLHYRISLLAGQDCSFSSSKTYDIEVWMPARGQYYEVSSCSNCTDFQARRGLIRYKAAGDAKTTLVHTLNASSLALPRLIVAIMETYQQEDGSIAMPEVLKGHGLL